MATVSSAYTVDSISWSINHEKNQIMPNVVFKAITDGPDGDTIPVPDMPQYPAPKYYFPKYTPRCYYGKIP